MKSRLIILGALAILIIVVLANTVLIIDAGEMAVIFNQVYRKSVVTISRD